MVGNQRASRSSDLFEVRHEPSAFVVTPRDNLNELEFERIEAGTARVLTQLGDVPVRHLVVDFRHTDCIGSTALAMLVRLWKWARGRGGRMAFCHVSDHERAVLHVAALDALWPICGTLDEALAAVRGCA